MIKALRYVVFYTVALSGDMQVPHETFSNVICCRRPAERMRR